MNRIFIGFAAALVATGCGVDIYDRDDAGRVDSGRSDAGTELEQRCAQLSADWYEFQRANRGPCASDDECVLYGTIPTCECDGYYDVPGGAGPTLVRSALEEAERRFPEDSTVTECRFVSTPYPNLNSGICDAWYVNPRCLEGVCVSETRGDTAGVDACLPSARPDAGVDGGP